MNLLRTITDEDFGGKHDDSLAYGERLAMRAILIRADGKIATMYVGKYDYYKLPGGGVDEGESEHDGLIREIREEVGCEMVKGKYLGTIVEYRGKQRRKQTNHCYVCSTQDTIFTPSFTENERTYGCELHRYHTDDLVKLMQGHHTDNHKEQFKMLRDLVFVEEFLRIE